MTVEALRVPPVIHYGSALPFALAAPSDESQAPDYDRVAVRVRGGRMGDPDSWQQEQISLAYMSAVATQAGATVAAWNVDKDSVDITLKRGTALIEFQMKCTFDAHLLADGETHSYDLDVRAYDNLRHEHRMAAGYLGLVVVSRDVDEWLEHNVDAQTLLIRASGYYAQLQDGPAATGKATKAIHLPVLQRIDSGGLDVMFKFAHERLFGPIQEGSV